MITYEYVFLGMLLGVVGMLVVRAIARRRQREVRVHNGTPFHGWARISLLGRTEMVGAAREVRVGDTSYLEVLTVDGRAVRTQYSAIYSIERVPFGVVDKHAELEAEEKRRRAEFDAEDTKRFHEMNDEKNERIGKLCGAIAIAFGHAQDYFDDGDKAQPADVHLKIVRDVLDKALEEDRGNEILPF